MPTYARVLLITVSPDEAAEAVEGHRGHLQELRRAGKLRLAGSLAGDEGFVEILDVADLHEADALTRDSPLVRDGLASWILREWHELTLS